MLALILALFLFTQQLKPMAVLLPKDSVLAVKSMSLNNRYPQSFVNNVFKENILLTLAYMQQRNTIKPVNIQGIDKPFRFSLKLRKGEVFAFHDSVLPEYDGKIVATTHAHFNYQEGFVSDGYLTGDGVCHLASLINFAAKSAGLKADAPTSHDFANIPEVPKEYGVAIYTIPAEPTTSALQNLYITNTLTSDVTIAFDYQNSILKVSILKQTS
jgi:hypothetical protein